VVLTASAQAVTVRYRPSAGGATGVDTPTVEFSFRLCRVFDLLEVRVFGL
jgi:hypothetical protein